MKFKDITNEELINDFEMLTVESVHKQNSGIGTKGLILKIEKIKEEILRRLNIR